MFYGGQMNLSKRGPLGKIWIAAHWEKKLSKAQVYETNIESSVEAILEPRVKMALRTTGHLLLGVVRIYSRKANYLLADCNQAFVKIKMAFRPGVVDLEENREAEITATTLKENFHEFDTDFSNFEIEAVEVRTFNINQGRPEDITMKEDLGQINIVQDANFDDFGGMDEGYLGIDDRVGRDNTTLGEKERERDRSSMDGLGDSVMGLTEDVSKAEMDRSTMGPTPAHTINDDFDDGDDDMGGMDDDFGDDGEGIDGFLSQNLFGTTGAVEEGTSSATTGTQITQFHCCPAPAESAVQGQTESGESAEGQAAHTFQDLAEDSVAILAGAPTGADGMSSLEGTMGGSNNVEQTTMVTNDESAFALEPLDAASVIGSVIYQDKRKKKRKLVVDKVKSIPSDAMKQQINDTSDIVTTLHLAPPFKKLMRWNEESGCDKLFSLPGRYMPSPTLKKLFTRNLSVLVPSERPQSRRGAAAASAAAAAAEIAAAAAAVPTPEEDKETEPAPEQELLDIAPLPDLRDIVNETLDGRTLDGGTSLQQQEAQDSTLPLQDDHIFATPDVPPPKRRRTEQQSVTKSSTESIVAAAESAAKEQQEEASLLAAAAERAGPGVGPEEEEELDMTLVPDNLRENGEDEVEAKKLHKRSQQMVSAITKALGAQAATGGQENHVGFLSHLLHKGTGNESNPKQAAAKFYTLLVLAKQQMVKVKQDSPYGEINISKGANFATAA